MALKILFWAVVPLAIASAISVLMAVAFGESPASILALRVNNSFGFGAQAALDAGRVWIGGDWVLNDSWTPMLRALEHVDSGAAAPLYEAVFFGEGTKFQYPPTSLLPLELIRIALPLTSYVLNVINSIVMIANAAATALLAWLVWREAAGGPASEERAAEGRAIAIAAFAASWLFVPLTRAFQLGQIQLWIDLAFTAACVLWIVDRRAAAGFAVGLASLIKPQLGLFVVWALVWREWKFAGGFLLAALPIGLISLWRYGWDAHLAYLDVLSFISQHGESYYRNSSVNGLVNRLLFNGTNLEWQASQFAPFNTYVYAVTMLASVIFVALPLAVPFMQRGRPANIYDFGAAALCFTLASPLAWDHHYGIMLPLFVILLGSAVEKEASQSRRTTLALLTVAWTLSAGLYVAVNLLSGTLLNVLQSYVLFGALLLLNLLLKASGECGSADGPVGEGRRSTAERVISGRGG